MNREKLLKENIATLQTEIDDMKAGWKDEAGNDRKPTKEEYQAIKAKLDEMKDVKEQLEVEQSLAKNQTDVQGGAQKKADVYVVQDEADQKYESFGEFARDVAVYGINGKMPKMLQYHETRMAASGMSEGKPSEGGFLVDPEYSQQLIEKVHNTGLLASRVRKMSTNSNVVKLPYIDETSRADGSRLGGVRGYWSGEANQMTSSNMTFGEMTFELKKLTGLSYVTDELVEDAPMLNSYLFDGFVEEFGFKLDDAILNGTGGGQPLGILNSNALVSVSKESGQAANTFLYENAVAMYAQLWSRSRPNAVVVMNQDVIPQLFTLNLAVGTGGSALYVPAGGASARPYDTLLGMPIIYSEQAQTLGTKGDVYFFDPTQYILVDKAGGIKSASSIHLRFDYNETAFRWIYRVDGQPAWVSAITPYKGSNDLSPYVALNTRS
jgi:HK97 family phage major capsid protein